MHTLGVHKVADRNRVSAIDLRLHALKHDVLVRMGADAHVLLLKVLHLHIEGCLLLSPTAVSMLCVAPEHRAWMSTYELLREGDLLELHLVDSSRLGGAEQQRCRQQGTLHAGQLGW